MKYYSDLDIARILSMSPEYVRGQRSRRKHNLPHWLEIDPIYVGNRPRYRAEEFHAFLEREHGSKPVSGVQNI